MNGHEYTALFNLVTEARDEAKACGVLLVEHGRRLGALEDKVDKNITAVIAGRTGLKVLVWVGGAVIASGAFLITLWDRIGHGPN